MVIRCNSAVSRLVVLFIGLSIFPASSWAQTDETTRYTLVLRNTSIEEALEELVSLTKINLVYDPKLLTDAAIFCNAKDETAEKILSCITQGANLDFYRLSSGTYVLTEPPQEEPRFGALAGIVVDAETGTPLPYANVLLADASTGTATNSAGMFAFASLLSGPHAIVTTYLGYETALDSVWIPPDGDARQYIELTPAPVVSAPIIVNGLQQRLPSRDLGSGRLDPADFQRPGNSGAADVVYSLNSVMNVGLRAPFVDLHIQGGETNENIMLLDGVPVFEPVSLGRMLGAFSPLAIDRITVYKAGFGAGVGSQLSGVLSAEQRLSAAPRDRLTFLIDPLSVNGRVNASFELPGPANAQFMLAGRSSVWDLYQSDVLASMLEEWNAVDGLLTSTVLGAPTDALAFTPHRHGSDVRFSDIHAAGQIQLDAYKKLSFSFYQGKNEIASELLTSEALQGAAFIMLSRDRYAWNNSTAQMRYEWLMGARALGVMRIRNSTHNLSHNYQFQDTPSADLPAGLDVPEIERRLGEIMDASGSPDDKNRLRETAFETFIDYSFAKDHHLAAGLEIIQSSSRFSLDNPFFVPLDLEYADWRVSGFMEDRISIGLQTSIEAGARLTYVPDRKTMYAEPRLAFRYDVSQSSVGPYSIHLATGIYRQYVNPFDLSNPGPSAAVPYLRFWLPIDETLVPPTAYHFTANALVNPSPSWKLRLETYYKAMPQIVALDYHALLISGVIVDETIAEDDFIDSTSGYAFGGGAFVEHSGPRSVASIQYSYSESKRRFPGRFENRLETTPRNEPHRLSVAHDFFVTPDFTTRLRAHGIWGRAWGFRQSYYDYLAAHAEKGQYAPFNLDHPTGDKLPAYYQIDAGVAYEYDLAGAAIQLRADVINLLDRRNLIDWSLQRPSHSNILEKVERRLPGRSVALSLRVSY